VRTHTSHDVTNLVTEYTNNFLSHPQGFSTASSF
jgi:hypothetical protein